ncbi:hypothetical protein LCGC14_1025170 [marine sediment metagenome]|uniref:Uncharacterized protein n=1 Tax=marine sediment metagenome TaxID=412755 RepID=A0A0F9NHW6_9ZZZZ
MARISYIPDNPTEVIEDEGLKTIIYSSDTIHGKPKATAFSGRRQEPDFNYIFKSVEQRSEHIEQYLESLRNARARKDEAAQRRKDFEHDFIVGDILYTSWGYDQTNVNFFQVTEVVSKKSVRIREIASSVKQAGFMSGEAIPRPDAFLEHSAVLKNNDGTSLKRVQPGNTLSLTSYSSAYKWDGKPKYTSWYA